MRVRIALALAVAGLLAVPAGASANFHLMKVSEVYPGSSAASYEDAFIELQMIAAGQNLTDGHDVTSYTSTGSLLSTLTMGTTALATNGPNVPNGENQRTILIGDTGVAGRDYTYDLSATLHFASGGGALCFNDAQPVDCVSWGSFTGDTPLPAPGAGSPVLPVGGIPNASSISRKITPNCETLLESADDTDNSAADFAKTAPSPRGNSVAPTEKACGAGGGDGPGLEVTGKETQKAGKAVKVKASCEEACFVEASGKVKLKGGGGASSAAKAKLKDAEADVAAGETATLKLKLAKPKAKKVKNTVASGGKAKATVEVLATSESGEAEDKLKVKLK